MLCTDHHPAEGFFIQELVIDEREQASSRGEPHGTCLVTSGEQRNYSLCQTCQSTTAYISSEPGAEMGKSIHLNPAGFRSSLPSLPGKATVCCTLAFNDNSCPFQRYYSYSENKYLHPFPPCVSKLRFYFLTYINSLLMKNQ